MKPGCRRALLFLALLRVHQALVRLGTHYVAGLDWHLRRRVIVFRLIHLLSFSDVAQTC
jgi:hypothetical protein